MRLDLAERLRCPNDHAPTPLIVVASRVVDRDLIAGIAGCLTCHLEARVEDGVVRFTAPHDIEVSTAGMEGAASDEDVARTAALLGLSEPGGIVLLIGRYAEMASALQERFDVATVSVKSNGAIPFADQSFRAAAVDAGHADDKGKERRLLGEAARTLSVGGRCLTPHTLHLPPAVKELARDDREVVAEKQMEARMIGISRAPHPPHTANQ